MNTPRTSKARCVRNALAGLAALSLVLALVLRARDVHDERAAAVLVVLLVSALLAVWLWINLLELP